MAPQTFSRRTAVKAFAGASVLAASGLPATDAMAARRRKATFESLYRAARAEGKVVVYNGGSSPTGLAAQKAAFEKRFPGVTLSPVVDASKYHDARIDDQIASRNVVADVAVLQTLDDFPRWKREGSLLRYRPIGWEMVDKRAKDADGFYVGTLYFAFSQVVANGLGDAQPLEAPDVLKPEFKGHLAIGYPNDDDAVLLYVKQLTDKYGFAYLKGLLAQEPKLVRGATPSAQAVGSDGVLAALSTSGLPTLTAAHQELPRTSPFVTWPQTAAILRAAPHKAAAKLYLSWLLSKEAQSTVIGSWSVRRDVAPPAGRRPLRTYANTDPGALLRFLSDKPALDRYRARVGIYFGEVRGEYPTAPDRLGRRPIDQQGTQG